MSYCQRQKWIFAIATCLLLTLMGLIALIQYTPVYVETKLLPRWAAEAGFDLTNVRIRRMGWRGSDLGPIQLKLGAQPFLAIDAVQIDYSPLSLFNAQISGIVFSGVRLEVTLDDRGTAIEGFPTSGSEPSAAHGPISLTDIEKWLSIGIGHLAIRNAGLTVHWRTRTLYLPMALEVSTRRAPPGQLHLTAQWTVRDNLLDFSLDVNARANSLDLVMTGDGLRPEEFSDLLALFGPITATGAMNLQGQVHGALHPFALENFSMNAHLTQARIGVPGATLKNSGHGSDDEVPIDLALTSTQDDAWRWSAAPFTLDGAVQVTVPALKGRITRVGQGWQATADMETTLPPQSLSRDDSLPLQLISPLTLIWVAKAHPDAEGVTQFELNTTAQGQTPQQIVHIQQGQAMSADFTPHAAITGWVDQEKMTGRFTLSAADLSVRSPQGQAHCPQVTLSGVVTTTPVLDAKASVDFPATKISFDGGFIELPQNRIEAHLQHQKDAPWTLTGELSSRRGRAVQKSQGLEIRNLSLRLPLRWPTPPAALTGEWGTAQLFWKTQNIGNLKGTVGLKGQTFWAKLQHQSKLFPGLIVQMHSEAGAWGAKATAQIPTYAPVATLDMGRLVPTAAGYTAGGRLQASGFWETDSAGTRSGARINIDQGVIRQARTQLVVEGIATDLQLVDLQTLRSAPQQHLRVEALTMGNLAAQALQVDFQLEPGKTLFIERADLKWCQGDVQAQALRLRPDLKDLEVTLYCDRLNLATVLGQLGAAQGSGKGEVNGRIPMRWRNGSLSFDNGFLYSTPGQTGTIQLNGTQMLLNGLPPDSPQRIQLDIATEALRDYSYNWAKLRINSQNDILLLRLQLDGKPNQLLPFAYDTQSGSFIRLEGKGEAEFKGISIDLNFKTPLKEILHYRQLAVPEKK